MGDIYQDRKCANGGFLVNSSRDVGNPHEFFFSELMQVLGCSNLACESENCGGVKVLQSPDYTFKEGTTPAEAYWHGKQVPSSRHVEKWEGVRLYSCQCTSWTETSYTHTYPEEPHDYLDRVFPWRCQGHSASSITPEVGRANAYTLLGGEVGWLKHQNSDLILRLWSSADHDARAAITSTVTDALRSEKRVTVLARALSVAWPVCGTGLTEVLSQLDPSDARFNANDPTRSGWILRQRLSYLAEHLKQTVEDQELRHAAGYLAERIGDCQRTF